MIRPPAERVGGDAIACAGVPGGMSMVCLRTMKRPCVVLEVAPHAVQVDRVRHHRVVDEHDAHALAVGRGAAARRPRTCTPSNDHAKRSMWPVRCSSIVRVGSRPSGSSKGCAGRRRSARAARCRAGRCPGSSSATSAPSSACRRADCRARSRDALRPRPSAHACRHAWPARRIAGGVGIALARARWRRVAAPQRAFAPPWPMSAIVSTGRGSSGRHRRARSPARDGQRAGREAGAIHRLREDRERVLARAARRSRRRSRRRRSGTRRPSPAAPAWPSAATTVSFRPGMRTSKYDIAEPLIEAQPHALARREQARPVAGRRRAVHQVGVGGAGDVGEVGGAHAHLRPTRARSASVAAEPVARARRGRSRRPCAGGSCSSPTASSACGRRARGSSSVQSVSITTCSRSYANGSGSRGSMTSGP